MLAIFKYGNSYTELAIKKEFDRLSDVDPNATMNHFGFPNVLGKEFISIKAMVNYSFVRIDDDLFKCIYVTQFYKIVVTSMIGNLESKVIDPITEVIIDTGNLDYLLRLYFDKKYLVSNYKEAFGILMDSYETKSNNHVGTN